MNKFDFYLGGLNIQDNARIPWIGNVVRLRESNSNNTDKTFCLFHSDCSDCGCDNDSDHSCTCNNVGCACDDYENPCKCNYECRQDCECYGWGGLG